MSTSLVLKYNMLLFSMSIYFQLRNQVNARQSFSLLQCLSKIGFLYPLIIAEMIQISGMEMMEMIFVV